MEATMKAMMSDSSKRDAYVWGLVYAHAGKEWNREQANFAAISEAQAILAASEPSSNSAENRYTQTVSLATLHDGYKALLGVPGRHYTIRTEEAQILAESLTAFVAQ